MEIKVYGAPSCPNCEILKRYLKAAGLIYDYVDVRTNQEVITFITEAYAAAGKVRATLPFVIIDGIQFTDYMEAMLHIETNSQASS